MNLDKVDNLEQLFGYFDGLIELDCDDQLFAASYLRGFIEVAAVEYGELDQLLVFPLYTKVDQQVIAAQSELSEQDQVIVSAFWQSIKPRFKAY
ncbi:YfcL family protein [Thalassotalea psychrophila]|uniref:YfcL family protein n=1 Tax=Thalassotalea psychrophila TaxID=3065647 RepID=A0ABY9TY74_9GAMM|nr:YfcL family protein [Colwelliaceae bacterium SQ149]